MEKIYRNLGITLIVLSIFIGGYLIGKHNVVGTVSTFTSDTQEALEIIKEGK